MKAIIRLLIVGVLISTSIAQSEVKNFIIDDRRNHAEFKSRAPVENVTGITNNVTGTLSFDPTDLSLPVKATVKVDLRTLKTGIDARDGHMYGETYLHTEVFPFAIFEIDTPIVSNVKSMTKYEPIEVTLTGKFTLKGVTQEVTLTGNATYFGEVEE